MEYEEMLVEADKIYKDRQEQYGDPEVCFLNASDILLKVYGLSIAPADIVKTLIAVKDARQMNKHSDDSVIDNINYRKILKLLTTQK